MGDRECQTHLAGFQCETCSRRCRKHTSHSKLKQGGIAAKHIVKLLCDFLI